MEAKQKAKELIEQKIIPALPVGDANINYQTAKRVALAVIDEIISATGAPYWHKVKKEIELL